MFLKISQNWQENTCVGVSFNFIEKEASAQVFSCEFCAKFLIYFGRAHPDDCFFKYLFRVVVKVLAFMDVASLFLVLTLDICLSSGKGHNGLTSSICSLTVICKTLDICSKLTKITLLFSRCCYLWTDVTHRSGVSIIDFEQVNVGMGKILRRSLHLWYKTQSIDLPSKSIDWFLHG